MLTLKEKCLVVIGTLVFAIVMLAGAAVVTQPMNTAIHAQAAK